MKSNLLASMPPLERRRFLRNAGALLALPLFSDSFRYAFWEEAGGTALAQAKVAEPLFFLEVNFRDQWDFGTAFVAPGLAGLVGEKDLAVVGAATKVGPTTFLTESALDLRDHADSIAIIEAGESCIGGIHHHEAGNALRSPGRSYQGGGGRRDMATFDKRPGGRAGGNEVLYSASPTPAILHNHAARTLVPGTRNGVLLRSSVRADTHTFYHFEASLENAQLERFYTRENLLKAFEQPLRQDQSNVLSDRSSDVTALIKRLDARYLKEIDLAKRGMAHDANLARLNFSAKQMVTDLRLSAAEMDFWSKDVPGQFECPGDNSDNCTPKTGSYNLGEMFGYVGKLFASGTVRTAAIDFDFHDVHTPRTDMLLRTQAIQTARPLARLIKTLKDAGIYDRTVIAMYTLDGSRSPSRNSTGQFSKVGFVMAGGGVRGGYYGDVRRQNGSWTYHRPDDTGAPVSAGIQDGQGNINVQDPGRVAGRDVYRTVAKASGVPDGLVDALPDAKDGKVLSYLLK